MNKNISANSRQKQNNTNHVVTKHNARQDEVQAVLMKREQTTRKIKLSWNTPCLSSVVGWILPFEVGLVGLTNYTLMAGRCKGK